MVLSGWLRRSNVLTHLSSVVFALVNIGMLAYAFKGPIGKFTVVD